MGAVSWDMVAHGHPKDGTWAPSTGGYSIQYDSCNTCVSPGERPADRTGAAVHVHDCMFRLIIPLNNVFKSFVLLLPHSVCVPAPGLFGLSQVPWYDRSQGQTISAFGTRRAGRP